MAESHRETTVGKKSESVDYKLPDHAAAMKISKLTEARRKPGHQEHSKDPSPSRSDHLQRTTAKI